MNPELFLAFVLVAAALACTPGVDWAYSIAAGLGRRSFLPAVAGLCSGYVLHTVLMVAGLAAVLAASPGLLGWLTVAGSAYLLWLGAATVRSWRGASFTVADDESGVGFISLTGKAGPALVCAGTVVGSATVSTSRSAHSSAAPRQRR